MATADPDPIFDFTFIQKNRPHLPDVVRIEKPMHPADIPLAPSMEQMLREEFKAYKQVQEEAEYREWKARRFSVAA